MQEELLHFDVSSPFELTQALRLAPKQKDATRFAELRLYGPDILARQFEVPRASLSALGNVLRLECAEILSIGPKEIELDYSVLHTSAENVKGLFIAVSQRLLREYLSCFDNSNIMPVSMTAQIIARLADFLRTRNIKSSNFCVLDLFKSNTINLSVFIDGHCELIRAIRYDTEAQAEQEIINSLRYVCSRSSSKQLREIYFSGDLSDREEFISRLREKIEVNPKADSASSASYPNTLLNLSLVKKYSISLPLRNRILQMEKLALAICIIVCLFLGLEIMKKSMSINKLRSSLNLSSYKYALGLEEKIKTLRNEK